MHRIASVEYRDVMPIRFLVVALAADAPQFDASKKCTDGAFSAGFGRGFDVRRSRAMPGLGDFGIADEAGSNRSGPDAPVSRPTGLRRHRRSPPTGYQKRSR